MRTQQETGEQQLDSLQGLVATLTDGRRFWVREIGSPPMKGSCHCSRCGDTRRHYVAVVARKTGKVNYAADVYPQICPAVFEYTCTQCDGVCTALLYKGPAGYELVVFADHHGGIKTPHTPEPVAYYLDQAWRSRSSGARSAAVAMYRAALEQVLYEQGFQKKMLGPKIQDLQDQVAAGTAPVWAKEIGTQEMAALKELGNGSIHPNDGDIEKQRLLDDRLLRVIESFLKGMMLRVYEVEEERSSAAALLKQAAQSIKS